MRLMFFHYKISAYSDIYVNLKNCNLIHNLFISYSIVILIFMIIIIYSHIYYVNFNKVKTRYQRPRYK
jgi:hypothetical protein